MSEEIDNSKSREKRSLQYVVFDGIFSWTMVALTGGAFLTDFSLNLGASNFLIGLIAAIPFLGNAFQLPAVSLIQLFPNRRLLTLISTLVSRIFWGIIAFIPLLFVSGHRLLALPILLFFSASVAAIANACWNSWMKDLVPDPIRGRFFSRRLSISLGVGLVVSLLAGWLIDLYKTGRTVEEWLLGYTVLFSFATLLGFIGSGLLYQAHEPLFQVPKPRRRLKDILEHPLKDKNYRRVLISIIAWSFALNLSAPFYTVFMFKRLGLTLTTVVSYSVFAQVMNIAFLIIWGKIVDRFGNKPVFYISCIFYMISLGLWPFTALPEPHPFTHLYLGLIHFLMGTAIAGIVISTINIVYKLAPKEEATAYLAVNGTLVSLVSALAPILGGFISHYFEYWEIQTSLKTRLPEGGIFTVNILDIRGLEYLFLLSIIIALYALERLTKVKEVGEAPTEVVYNEFFRETRRTLRNISTTTGIFYLLNIPAFLSQRRTQQEQKDKDKSMPGEP